MAESAASAPPPRPGPPLIPPPRASQTPAGPFVAGRPAAGEGAEGDEEAWPALVSAPGSAPGFAAGGGGEDDGPPLEELEAQMGRELAARDSSAAAVAPAARRRAAAPDEDEDDGARGGKAPLPELDSLVARIPEDVRATLEELFRARFVAVKKLPKKLLQPAASKNPATDAAH